MPQEPIPSSQNSGSRRRETSEMMKCYLASRPSTTTERLIQGNVMSDQDIIESLEQKISQLETLVSRAKGENSRST